MSTFESLRAKCLEDGVLYDDPEFPATHKSVYFSKVDPRIQWRRPKVGKPLMGNAARKKCMALTC